MKISKYLFLFIGISTLSSCQRGKETYPVVFKNYDGTVISSQLVKRGEMPTFIGETPTKESSEHFDYVFDKWEPELHEVKSSQTYVASFIDVAHQYALDFKGEGCTIDGLSELHKVYTYNDDIELKIKPNNDELLLKDDIKVTLNDDEYKDFKYNYLDGTFKMKAIGNIKINIDTYNAASILDFKFENSSPTVTFEYDGELKGVDWGDGTIDKNNTHKYSLSGTDNVSIKIFGKLNSIALSNSSNVYSEGNKYINSIKLNSPLNNIPSYAFNKCENLKNISISKTIYNIGKESFNECNNIESIQIDKENNMYSSNNGSNAIIYTPKKQLLLGCKNTTNLPSDLLEINDYAFYNCKELPSISIPNSVIKIGDYAFYNCQNLTELSIGYSSNLLSIGEHCFERSSISSVYIPKYLNSIGKSAFGYCTYIGLISCDSNNQFYKATNNCLIKIENNEIILGYDKSTIPTSATSIGDRAFEGCATLNEISIPSNIVSIGNYAFYNCENLSEVILPNKNDLILGAIDMFKNCSFNFNSIKVPNALLSQYMSAPYWSNYSQFMVGV